MRLIKSGIHLFFCQQLVSSLFHHHDCKLLHGCLPSLHTGSQNRWLNPQFSCNFRAGVLLNWDTYFISLQKIFSRLSQLRISFTGRNHLILMFKLLHSGLLCILLFRGNASGGPVEADREARSRGLSCPQCSR